MHGAQGTPGQPPHALNTLHEYDWELLLELADTSGQPEIAESFYKALSQEQVHLETIRSWLRD